MPILKLPLQNTNLLFSILFYCPVCSTNLCIKKLFIAKFSMFLGWYLAICWVAYQVHHTYVFHIHNYLFAIQLLTLHTKHFYINTCAYLLNQTLPTYISESFLFIVNYLDQLNALQHFSYETTNLFGLIVFHVSNYVH